MTMATGSENVPANILVEAIREQIETARKYKMSYAEVVGVLEMVKHEMIDEAKETVSEPVSTEPVAIASGNLFEWMDRWLNAFDAANPGEHGKKIAEWVQDQPMGC